MLKKSNQFLKSITIIVSNKNKIKKYSYFFTKTHQKTHASCSPRGQHVFLKLGQHLILACFTIVPRRRHGLLIKVDVHLLNSVTIIPVVLRHILVVSHQNMLLEALTAIMRLNPMWYSVDPHGCNVQRRLPIRVLIIQRVILPNIEHSSFRVLHALRIDAVYALGRNELLKELLQPRLRDRK